MAALKVFLLYSLLLLTIKLSVSFSPKHEDVSFATKYLKQFHYISPLRTGNHDLRTAVELFQKFMHLPVTGNIDETLITEMKKPRCGVPDYDASPSGRTKRFAVAPWKKKWNKTSLTYAFVNYGDDMSTSDFDSVMMKAFKIWADRSQLCFKQVKDVKNADIKISFGRRTHAFCGYPFDGPGNVMGHTFYPPNGNIHFDDDEDFTDGTYSGKNLLAVAVHEIGHVIGIGHSSVKNSVMYPQYKGYDRNLRLHADDINAAAYLYGGPTVIPPTHPKPTVSPCQDSLPNCAKYIKFCKTSASMRKYCRRTCGFCNKPVVKCVDEYPTRKCKWYKAKGHCGHPMVAILCRKTCQTPNSNC